MRIDTTLAKLERLIERHPQRCLFKPGATLASLNALERRIGQPLPDDYKRFLRRCDGGFIALSGEKDDEDWDEESAAWNSNTLFGTKRLASEFRDQKLIWEKDRDWPKGLEPHTVPVWEETPKRWSYVPFCQTSGQELLVFAPASAERAERPVLDAHHETGPHEWSVPFGSFTEFLEAYVKTKGEPQTIGGISPQTWLKTNRQRRLPS